MNFFGKTSAILALALQVGLVASATDAAKFLAQHPDIQVGREALEKAEASSGPDTFSIVNKPADSIVLYQTFDANTNERISAVALVDDAKAETYYNTYNKDGDAVGTVMERFATEAMGSDKDSRELPQALFARASRCGQFCSRSSSCTDDPRCSACRYVGGNNRHQLSCQPRI